THLVPDLRYTIDRAAFFFCRDTISRDYLKAQGVRTPVLEFGPDAQPGTKLRDNPKGLAFLNASGLVEGKLLCVIPRLRYTPYNKDEVKDAIRARTAHGDHAKLREMIVAYVKNTGNRVLACPEMTYQVALAKEMLVDPLSADVKKNVVWRDSFWSSARNATRR
ncbi:MAG: hypothetical protein JWP63_5324, partial [Candidatus Solibacter sp.]|nr:hypothetical protein [Candidatus Solibacter sp.]